MKLPAFWRKPKTVGLELRRNYFNLVEMVWEKENAYLHKAVNVVINTVEPEELGELLRSVISKYNINGRHINLGIEARNVIIRQLKFPLLTPEELQQNLKWESDRYLPLPPDDLMLDFNILEKFPENVPPEMQVILVGVKRSLINEYLAIAEQAGLILDFIEVTPFSFLRALEAEKITGTAVLLNVVNDNTEMMVISNGLLRFNRVIENIRPEALALDVQRSLDFYHTQYWDTPVEKIIVSGASSRLDELIPMLDEVLQLPVEKADLMNKIKISKKFAEFYIKDQLPSMAAGLGLALRKER